MGIVKGTREGLIPLIYRIWGHHCRPEDVVVPVPDNKTWHCIRKAQQQCTPTGVASAGRRRDGAKAREWLKWRHKRDYLPEACAVAMTRIEDPY